MIKKIEKTIKICDICKKEVPHFAIPEKDGAAIPQIRIIRISKYQEPGEMLDVCQDCSNELLATFALLCSKVVSEDE
jgi:hypothetical protein